MKFKRASAALLAAALAVPAMSITAFAEEDAAMKKALTYVKQRIDIPSQCSEFNYSTRTENNGKRYSFTWTLPDDTDYENFPKGSTGSDTISYIRVEIMGNVIKRININHYDNGNWEPSFAKMTNEELLEAAKKLVTELNPKIDANTVVDEDSLNISLYGDYAYVNFHREVLGIPVTGQTGTIGINKNTGELLSYSYNWTNSATFNKPDKAISLDAAKEAYKSLFGSEINYTLYYDWEKKEYVPHLVYSQTDNGQINAFTGKLSDFSDYDTYENGVTMDDADMAVEEAAMDTKAYGAAVTFTPNEIKKLEDESKLITAEDALKAIAKYDFFFVPETSEISWENCSYDDRNGYYVRNVSFVAKSKSYIDLSGSGKEVPIPYYEDDDTEDEEDYGVSGSFRINAETGELLSFNCYTNETDKSLSDSTAKKTVTEAAKKLLGDGYSVFGELNEINKSSRYLEYDPKTGLGKGSPITTSITYRMNRQAYGINCQNEYASFTIGNNGYISNFAKVYHPEISYPDPAKKVSADQAYEEFFKVSGLGLKYRVAYRTEDKKVVSALVYAADRTMFVDALTGKMVNYDYTEYKPGDKQEYTDLENSKYRTYAEKLASYGIFLIDENGKLSENESITASDFVNLTSNVGMGYVDLSTTKVKADAKLTRQTAAMLAVTGKYGKDIAELTSIFKAKFSDVPETSKYIGYIAIADASGWIKGGSNGNYQPTAAFTRGEALKMVYNYLARA